MSSSQALVYVISDGTGETATTMMRAALVQYQDREVNIIRYKNVRTEEQIEALLEEVFKEQGLVVHTVVSTRLRKKIAEECAAKGLRSVDLLGPIFNALDLFIGQGSHQETAGLLRTVDDRYFRRIEAIEFTVKHDDGKMLEELDQADIILVGVSRTSKTPLSIFLSHKGWKVANVPIVVKTPLPQALFTADQRKIVGLVIDPDVLVRIRRKRLEKFGQDPGGEYASLDLIHKEIDYAQSLFRQNRRWPVFDVTDRALEETAAEIIRVVASRMDLPYGALL